MATDKDTRGKHEVGTGDWLLIVLFAVVMLILSSPLLLAALTEPLK